jgi:hypothetical protein
MDGVAAAIVMRIDELVEPISRGMARVFVEEVVALLGRCNANMGSSVICVLDGELEGIFL